MKTRQEPHIFLHDPHLKGIEVRCSNFKQKVFSRHTHESYAVGLVLSGNSNTILEKRTTGITAGDTIFIPPGTVHACNPASQEALSYLMFYIQPTLFAKICVPSERRMEPSLPWDIFHNDSELFREFKNLLSVMKTSHDPLQKQSQLYHSISLLWTKLDPQRKNLFDTGRQETQNMYQAHQYLMAHLFENITLDELAAQAALSPYHFIRVFHSVYGMTPHAYRLQKRIQAGRRMIAGGIPIARVAMQTGFTDQSHFTRRFKAYVGMTPNEFQHSLHCF